MTYDGVVFVVHNTSIIGLAKVSGSIEQLASSVWPEVIYCGDAFGVMAGPWSVHWGNCIVRNIYRIPLDPLSYGNNQTIMMY